MPTYEYACKSCGEHQEVVQSFRDDALTTCPSCGGALRKVFGSIGISFKGSGFYKTDSRSSSAKPAAKKEAASSASSDSSTKESGSSAGSSSSGSSDSGSGGSGSGGSGSGGSGSGDSKTKSAAAS
jgi:putative FmdB family regulatory protein